MDYSFSLCFNISLFYFRLVHSSVHLTSSSGQGVCFFFFSEVVSVFTLCGNSFAFIPPLCYLKFIVSKDKFVQPPWHEYLSLSHNFKQDVFFPNTSVIVSKEREENQTFLFIGETVAKKCSSENL